MPNQPPVAFVAAPSEPAGLEIRVNFGVFAGREATAAELDELGRAVLGEVKQVAIVSESRHEMDSESEASIHQVRIEVPWAALPVDESERSLLCDLLVSAAERWARACSESRHADVVEL